MLLFTPHYIRTATAGTYPKRHLHTLVELVHETLKTLDTAQVRIVCILGQLCVTVYCILYALILGGLDNLNKSEVS